MGGKQSSYLKYHTLQNDPLLVSIRFQPMTEGTNRRLRNDIARWALKTPKEKTTPATGGD